MEDRAHSVVAEESLSGWAQSEALDLADAARQRIHDAAGAREYVRSAIDKARELAYDAGGYVGGVARQARHKASEYREGGFDKVKGYTREQPVTALLIATGAGLLLGWLSGIGRR